MEIYLILLRKRIINVGSTLKISATNHLIWFGDCRFQIQLTIIIVMRELFILYRKEIKSFYIRVCKFQFIKREAQQDFIYVVNL